MRIRWLGLSLLVSAFGSYLPTGTATAYSIDTNVQYCTGGGQPLLLDVFIPTARVDTPTPAVLWIHGGGWETGDKSANSGANLLAGEGFVTASLSYRLSGTSPFPAAIEDCKCAIRFLRANASRYGIDPDRIGVAGSSSGGHLAELAGTAHEDAGFEGLGGWPGVSSRVEAVASYFGVSDLTVPLPPETEPVIGRFLRGSGADAAALRRRASPLRYVSKDDPPLLLVHGEQDRDVPFEQSARMAEAYRKLGLSVELIRVRHAGHDFVQVGGLPLAPSLEVVHRRTAEFFKRYLRHAGSTQRATLAVPAEAVAPTLATPAQLMMVLPPTPRCSFRRFGA